MYSLVVFSLQNVFLMTSSTSIVVTVASVLAGTVIWMSVLTQLSAPLANDTVWTGSEVSILAQTNFTTPSECVCEPRTCEALKVSLEEHRESFAVGSVFVAGCIATFFVPRHGRH